MRARQYIGIARWLKWKLTGDCEVRVGDVFVDEGGTEHRIAWVRGKKILTDTGRSGTLRRVA